MNDQILRYFQGELNAFEQAELIKLVEKGTLLKDEFICLQNIHALIQLSPHSTDRNEGQRNFFSFSQQIKRRAQRILMGTIAKYAAVAVVLIASTFWATLYFSANNSIADKNTLYVPAGQRAQITLQDGTEVWLNAQSTLTYPSEFSKKNREVEVVGEAFFNVTKDKKRPFVVSTQHINMKVLGTQFNVYSYPRSGYIQTDLVEGSIKIYDEHNEKNAVVLKPNEQVIIRNNKMIVGAIYNSEHLLWRDGIYSFQNERLIDIIAKLQLYYDVTIDVKDPDIFNVRYTGKFRQRDGIDEILRIIQRIQFFKIEKDINNNIITLKK